MVKYMDWALLILAIAVLLAVRKATKPKWIWAVRLIAGLLAGIGLALTSLGGWLSGGIGSLFGVAITGVLMLIALGAIALDVAVNRKSNKYAMAAVLMVPLLFFAASGPIAGFGQNATNVVHERAETGLSHLITDQGR